ncbi:MAG: DUF3833 domain-containing protein [Gammaproteobacteria bacterium]|nr:DUF3833 domain-containing protein [Gammaproteobacteria bacterium]
MNRNPLRSLIPFLSVALILSSCSSISVQDYSQQQPQLVMEEFFDGQLRAHGVVKNWRGLVIRTFNADIKAYWQDGVGVLEEDFVFDDGEQQRRVWTLRPTAAGGYLGTAGDVVGEADVQIAGNSVFLDYTLMIPWRDGSLNIRIDDRMYLVEPNVIINESAMSKFGLPVGQIQLVIRKQQDLPM